jgi:hypothetical protein
MMPMVKSTLMTLVVMLENVYDANRASEYNVPTVVNQTVSVSTLSATSITSSSCKFNSIISIPVCKLNNRVF